MIRRAALPVVVVCLVYGFWLSPDFGRIAAGVAIFLYGMLALEDGFRSFAGGALDSVLRRSTDRRWKSLAFGVVSTTLVQSSSLVTLLTISFLSSGLISLGGAIGIVFGANLGTTTGAWLVAGLGLKVSLSLYAMPMLVIGVLLVFQRGAVVKGSGYVLVGIGLLFLGIDYMKVGFEAFRDSIDLARYSVDGVRGLLLYTALGIAATVIMQSSHAVLILILAALAAAQVGYDNALALAIGSNIGTTVTAVVGSLGANPDGRRLAAAHLVFNLSTALVALLFIDQFKLLVEWIGGALGLVDDTMRLALFHSLFNVTGLALMLPLAGMLERQLERRFKAPSPAVAQPRYLNAAVKQFPAAAIEALHNETARLYDTAERIIAHALCIHRDDVHSQRPMVEVVAASRKIIREDINEKYAQNVKALYGAIVEFVSDVTALADSRQVDELHRLRAAGARVVEAVKAVKHLQKNLLVQMRSPNPVARAQYDRIRQLVAGTLRAVGGMRATAGGDLTVSAWDEARLALARSDIVTDGTLDRLIRDRSITPTLATSLMNDYGYAYRACDNLLEAARVLFIDLREPSRRAESALALDDAEIAALAGKDQH